MKRLKDACPHIWVPGLKTVEEYYKELTSKDTTDLIYRVLTRCGTRRRLGRSCSRRRWCTLGTRSSRSWT